MGIAHPSPNSYFDPNTIVRQSAWSFKIGQVAGVGDGLSPSPTPYWGWGRCPHPQGCHALTIRSFANNSANNGFLKGHQRLNVEPVFIEWLVGFTDGDGTFSISKNKNNNAYGFTFKLGQSTYNARILYYIKSQIGFGSITNAGLYDKQYRIRDKTVLLNKIVPYFEKYQLRTVKQYSFLLFKEALLNTTDADKMLDIKKRFKQMPLDYKSTTTQPMSKSWIVGFMESEGSFYITKKEEGRELGRGVAPPQRYVHGFAVTQKLDTHILIELKAKFGITAKIKPAGPNKVAWLLDTTNSRTIEYIIGYFKDQFIGMKAVEYRIWARSYYKHKGNSQKLMEIQKQLQNLRNRHKY